ncbi:MAG TPA: sugar phosphate nucleotidyltransferase [Candidatus Polarisedimenticolaceae bacterium]|nr:sugar phosphate nucleotidyltransferase [Candidatus Polarisedimenticolaceae bacterium]
MVLAAGLGERMRPLTLRTPKPALPVLGLTLIRHVFWRLRQDGVTHVVVNLHHLPEVMGPALEEAADATGLGVATTFEPEILGTGGGLRHASAHLRGQGTVVVRNADFLADVDLAAALTCHRKSGCPVTLALVPSRPGYSVVEADAGGRVVSLAGKPDPVSPPVSSHAFTGWQLVEDEVFERLPPGKSDTVRDLYRTLASEGRLNGFVHPGTWVELGSPVQMLDGVLTLLATSGEVRAAVLDPGADPVEGGIARGAGVAHEGARLVGRVALGAGSVLESEAVLEDVVALPGTRVGAECQLRRVLLAAGTSIPEGTELTDAAAGPSENGGLWVRSLA